MEVYTPEAKFTSLQWEKGRLTIKTRVENGYEKNEIEDGHWVRSHVRVWRQNEYTISGNHLRE